MTEFGRKVGRLWITARRNRWFVKGEFQGKTIRELVSQFPLEMTGLSNPEERLPLLLKYLDCDRVLSVQVHPDDAYGATMAVPDRGKTEAWYVIEAAPGAVLYAGLKQGVGRDELARAIAAGKRRVVSMFLVPKRGTVFSFLLGPSTHLVLGFWLQRFSNRQTVPLDSSIGIESIKMAKRENCMWSKPWKSSISSVGLVPFANAPIRSRAAGVDWSTATNFAWMKRSAPRRSESRADALQFSRSLKEVDSCDRGANSGTLAEAKVYLYPPRALNYPWS